MTLCYEKSKGYDPSKLSIYNQPYYLKRDANILHENKSTVKLKSMQTNIKWKTLDTLSTSK